MHLFAQNVDVSVIENVLKGVKNSADKKRHILYRSLVDKKAEAEFNKRNNVLST